MNCIVPHSRREIVNKFAELILNKINQKKDFLTQIEVTDFVNFFVVKGETESTEVLDLNQIKEEFFKENENTLVTYGIKNINIIDIIKYNVVPIPKNEYYFDFYNTKRPIYHQSVIDGYKGKYEFEYGVSSLNYTDKLETEYNWPIIPVTNSDNFCYTSSMSISSQFPYGYSLKMGKSYLYYSEYLAYQLFKITKSENLILKITNQTVDDELASDLDISVKTNSMYDDETIKSMILDVFDFNLSKFSVEYLKDYNFNDEIDNPLDKKPWLVYDMVSDMIIL